MPFLALGSLQLVETLLSELMLAESKRPHIVVLEDVRLQRFKVLALHEKFGDLCLNCHRMQVRDESVAHIGLSLEFPFTYTQVVRCADSQKLIEGMLKR